MDIEPQYFFTSDTHFTSVRTLALSCRPFKDTLDMDYRLISNWNNKVSENDIVYHLGDFGSPSVIHQLNFKKMYFLPGNYERKDCRKLKELEEDGRVEVLSQNKPAPFSDPVTGELYYLVHEPLFTAREGRETLQMQSDPNTFYLFGHIHRLQLVKRNGINVSCDIHNYTPVNLEEIRFLKEAIKNHYDENVFTDYCRPVFD